MCLATRKKIQAIKMQYSYSKRMFTESAKQIRITSFRLGGVLMY
jgi:hypothetical protein